MTDIDKKIRFLRGISYQYIDHNSYYHDLWYCDRVYYGLQDKLYKIPNTSHEVIMLIAYFHITGEHTHPDAYETISAQILENHKKQLIVNGFDEFDIIIAKQAIQEHRNIFKKAYQGFSNKVCQTAYEVIKSKF